ncbi:MAG: GPW/gp25 family protein [Planctomycetota bacterium]
MTISSRHAGPVSRPEQPTGLLLDDRAHLGTGWQFPVRWSIQDTKQIEADRAALEAVGREPQRTPQERILEPDVAYEHRMREQARESLQVILRQGDSTEAFSSVKLASGVADVNQSIDIILSTVRGERVMQPRFGCDLHEYVFLPRTPELVHRVEEEVHHALTMWERRIRDLEVRAVPSDSVDNRIDIEIRYALDGHRMRHSLIYPFYVAHPEGR